jgi:hypothetical protein
MSGSGRTSETYDVSYSGVIIPNQQDAIVSGFGNSIRMGSGDTLTIVHGDGDTVTGNNGGVISVSQSNGFTIDTPGATVNWDTPSTTMTILDGATVNLVETTGTPTINVGGSNTAQSAINGTSAVTVNVTQGDYAAVNDPNALLRLVSNGSSIAVKGLPAGASYAFFGNINGAADVSDTIVSYSQSGTTGTVLGSLTDFTDGTSAIVTPGPGYYGITQEIAYFTGAAGSGTNTDIVYNYFNGTNAASIDKILSPLNNGTGIINGQATFSGPNDTGSLTAATFNYDNGTSSSTQPGSGGFGVYQTVTYYTGADQTGSVFRTNLNIVTGHSQVTQTANGAFGIYQAVLRTEGLNGTGVIDSVILDVANGTSAVITPSAGDASETLTFMSGIDGSGRVVSTQTVASGTAVADFQNLTGATITNPVYATAAASVTLADFKTPAAATSIPVASTSQITPLAALDAVKTSASVPMVARLHA